MRSTLIFLRQYGGRNRDRTCDIQLVRLALSQLSYSPLFMAGLTGLEPATSSVTGWHSNQLSYNPSETNKELLLFLRYNIDSFFQRFSWFKLWNSCGRNINLLASLRILTFASCTFSSRESTKTDETEFITALKSSSYTGDKSGNGFFSFYFFQASLFCY